MRGKVILLSVVCLSMAATAAFGQSCPMCKESMTAAGEKLSHGFYLSIISMFSLPFLLIGGVSSIVYRSWWEKSHPGEILTFGKALRLVRKRWAQ